MMQTQAQPVRRYRRNHHPIMKTVLVIMVICIIVPLAVMLVWSLNALWEFPNVIPDSWTLRGYENLLFGSKSLGPVLATSAIVTTIVCLISVVIATLTAQALVFYEFPGKALLDFFVYLPSIIPAIVFGIGSHLLFIRVGLSGTVVGVIIAQTMVAMPYAIKMVTNATRIIGKKYVEQALVLGSTPVRAYFQVSFHLLFPTLISAICMAFTASFSDYFLTFLIGGGKVQTFAVAIVPMISGADMNSAAAYSVVYVMLSFAFFLILEWVSRRIMRKQELYLA